MKKQEMSTQKTTADNFDAFIADMASLHMSSDVEFLVEGQRLPGHRQVLAKRSEYFRALLCGSMLESRQREVRLEVPLEPFKAILEYLYTGKLPLSSLDVDMLIDVRDLAHFYCLGYVETLITGYLQQKMSVSNVCAILNAAKRCDLEQSIEECQTFMDQNAYDVLKHDSFQMLTKQSIEEFLRRDFFNVPEVDIFRAVWKWSDKNPSEDIKTVVSLVRLPLMSIDDLLHVVRPSGIIESDKLLDAIGQVNTGTNLPHRTVVLPCEDVASEKHHALRFTDNPNELVIQLRAVFLINQISIWNYNCSHSEIRLEVSCDQTHWDHVNKISAVCHMLRVGIAKRAVRYIRVKSCTRLNLRVMARLIRAECSSLLTTLQI
ncbi:BTB/POZ domain-containing protein 9 [Drosophila persimilis]|uniref:BTB/POZ domain-containing protein 9 n=1 Tax=Drosophila persimilis TaxID=7234 RepID=UPI000F086346|nr:BTB/POZ domain-containing protein 9 [Drosophila persimilis]